MIYFREGLDEEALANLLNEELPTMLSVANNLNPNFNSRAMVVTLQKSHIQRLFSQKDSMTLWLMVDYLVNPPSGTVVDANIISKNYEFYMVAHNATRGCVSQLIIGSYSTTWGYQGKCYKWS